MMSIAEVQAKLQTLCDSALDAEEALRKLDLRPRAPEVNELRALAIRLRKNERLRRILLTAATLEFVTGVTALLFGGSEFLTTAGSFLSGSSGVLLLRLKLRR